MGSVNLAHALAQWVLAAGISDQHQYEDMVWNKTKDVMKEFVDYMNTEDITSYAANCDNTGWEHYAYKKGEKLVTQTVGDRIVCVLMVGALFFMNWGNTTASSKHKEDENSAKITEHLRCIIVHMFGEILNESVCRSRWGIFYAWKQMEEMDSGKESFSAGLINQGTCGREIFPDLKTPNLKLNVQVKKWLAENSRLERRLKQVKGTNTCKTTWQKEWKIADFLNNEKMENKHNLEVTSMVRDVKEAMKEILEELEKHVERGVEQREEAKRAQLGKAWHVPPELDRLEHIRKDK
ncbi:hypothetical protein AK88_05412 [Plasmodium fragile]|uniref:Schizont-infected cell agglutination extracellular alpha domain-containing protein n=1 Tax=Plasmodium fragile TaxID=5857 RepID=A0A0D9QDN7_PLAFR|nr:uncharacterized protein AK88_05412 [Plasmodium fragile]KJP84957.1 hypothetical protein AK88_05412 [Plasmodium fragile]